MGKITKRERFLETSLKLINEKGFKATTMRDIAQKLNCEVANIYNYVDSKQSLLETYLFGISNEFHAAIDTIIESKVTSEEKLRLIIRTHIDLMVKKPYELALLVNEWRNLKEPKLGSFLAERVVYENKVKVVIQEGVEEGVFKNLDLEIVTYTFLSTLRWLHDKYTDHNLDINPDKIEKQISEFVFSGICKK
ncbi:TetR family transcriptional regulator [Maribacter vaceletii]|uniref:TetR family transcriptional regulator n=1 Tax=Maribacter vaceletii TaxID=1206816 RepID=A0A495EDG4_9FLAO|nr:TetR family transcriptional regulator [Maribacter vaceletii]RKR14922.1 TetR family transcriptional regulator [Maribacter vaceletii]